MLIGTSLDTKSNIIIQVNTYWNWGDVHDADLYLHQLNILRDSNATSEQ